MIKNLGNFFKSILFIISFTFSSLDAGSITSVVESKNILKGESVILTITIIGEKYETLPNIPRIVGAEVIGSNRSTKTRVILVNGKEIMEQVSILMLEFKPTTNITIPAFQMSIDGVMKSTQPIDINIVKSKPKKKADRLNFLIEMSSSKKSATVGEPFVIHVRFKQKENVEVKSIDYKEPHFNGFFSKRVENEKYEEESYTVNKLTYLLIAKDEGTIHIPPVEVRIEKKVKPDTDGFFSSKASWSVIKSSDLNIKIKKSIEKFDIAGDYKIKEGVDTQKIEINKPVNLKFLLEGEGSLEEFDGLKFDISGVTIYSDEPNIESKIIKDKLFSSYQTSYVFISDHDFEIPSKKIVVYNYHTKTIKILKTKAYKIVVEGSSKSLISPTVYTKNSVDFGSMENSISRWKGVDITWKIPPSAMLVLFFVLGGITALILKAFGANLNIFKLFKSKKYNRITHKEALCILYPHMNDTPEVEKITRALYLQQKGENVEIDRNRLKTLLIYYREKGDIFDSL